MSSESSETDLREPDDFYIKYIRDCVKGAALDEKETQVWAEQMKLKCQAYIRNSGIKTTTVEEVIDFVKEDALKSFPKNVIAKCEELVKEIQDSINNH